MKPLDQMHKDFGAFYPTGHMVVAFPQQEDARQVLHELSGPRLQAVEALEVSAQQMAEFAERNLHDAGFIASLGTSLTTVQSFLEAAKAGATFLIVATPNEAEAQRVSEAIHHVHFMLAERYHRLAIETVH